MTHEWLTHLEGNMLVAGYGSLLSKDSRSRFSNIHTPSLAVHVNQWSRDWVTRGFHEHQTYVGARPDSQSSLNAQLIPMKFDPSFELRERDYRFVKLDIAQIEFVGIKGQELENLSENLEKSDFYICETLDIYPSNEKYPVYLSYVLTCLIGCFEMGKEAEVHRFMKSTKGWDDAIIVDDLASPKYPRAASISEEMQRYLRQLVNL